MYTWNQKINKLSHTWSKHQQFATNTITGGSSANILS